jgi:ferrous iron transport protein A
LKSLANCSIGEVVNVSSILPSDIYTKLLEMGIYENKELTVVYKAPFGDPIAIQVGDYVLSMRLAEAELILVNPIP